MRLLHAAAIIVLFASPAFAQTTPVPRYGEVDKPKSPAEIESERAAEKAYRKSLGNVPNASAQTDPWGGIRSEGSAKPAAKATPAKTTKSNHTSN